MTTSRALRTLAWTFAALVGLGPAGAPVAQAEEWQFLGARYQAMGGAGVAVVDDAYATYWNPGALALTRPEGYGVAATLANAEATAEGDILRKIDRLARANDRETLERLLERLKAGTRLEGGQLEELLDYVGSRIRAFGNEGEGLLGSVGAGLFGHAGSFTVGAWTEGYWGIDGQLDLENFGFGFAEAAADRILTLIPVPEPRDLDADGQAVAARIAVRFEPFVDDAQALAEELVFRAVEAGVDLASPQAQLILERLAGATLELDAPFELNRTGVLVSGLLTTRLTLGYSTALLDDSIGVGGNLSYLYGVTFFDFVSYDDIDSVSEIVGSVSDFRSRATGHAVGIDLGILHQPLPWLRVGLTARNLNKPEFDFDVPDAAGLRQRVSIPLDPQIRGGVAAWVSPEWVVAADLDLTNNFSGNIRSFRSRLVSLGTEYRLDLDPTILALRGGAYSNVAEGSNHAVTLTAGVGVEVGEFAFNLALGSSINNEEVSFDDSSTNVPSRMNVALGLVWNHDL